MTIVLAKMNQGQSHLPFFGARFIAATGRADRAMQVVTNLMEQHSTDHEVAHELKVDISGWNAIDRKVHDDFNPGTIVLPGAMITANEAGMPRPSCDSSSSPSCRRGV